MSLCRTRGSGLTEGAACAVRLRARSQERDRLAKENEKLHYRVTIMKRELEAAEKKQ